VVAVTQKIFDLETRQVDCDLLL